MSNPVIRQWLLDVVQYKPVTVERDSELRDAVGLRGAYSKTQVNKAMGRLVKDGKVIRHREEPYSIGDTDRPITYCLGRPRTCG